MFGWTATELAVVMTIAVLLGRWVATGLKRRRESKALQQRHMTVLVLHQHTTQAPDGLALRRD